MSSPRLLLNPASARGRARARLRHLLRSVELDVRTTASPEETTEQARRAAAEGLDRLLVAGGDGTVHHAIRGLAGTECALGLVPIGTGNDLARALGLVTDPLRSARRALEGRPRSIDLGRLDGQPFAGVLGVGIDSDVCRLLDNQLRWMRGAAAYGAALLCALARFVPPHVVVDYDGGRFEGDVVIGAVANSPVLGGGMRIAPQAALDDGWLDVVIVRRVPLFTLLRLFPRVYRGAHIDHPAVQTHRVRRVRLRCDPPRTFYADGEPLRSSGETVGEVDLWPRALRVIAPA